VKSSHLGIRALSLSAAAAGVTVSLVGIWPRTLEAASHREAPLTAVDRTADITDFYAFVSPDRPDTATFILAVDPLLEPGNGPNYFPFDENVRYSIHVDNDHDAKEDVVFEFRFSTEVRAPGIPVGFIGVGDGVTAPINSPAPVAPGTPLVPPAITALDGPGSEGLVLRQTYTVSVRSGPKPKTRSLTSTAGQLIAVPSNVGPRTMPDYPGLMNQGIRDLDEGIRVFAGTTDDAFYIDLGAAFDTLNFRVPGSGVLPVLSPAQDAAEARFTPDDVSGYNVNTIAIQVPITLLTRKGSLPTASEPAATIGVWGETSRRQIELRRPAKGKIAAGQWIQVQRMANPLINELIIGTDQKDLWSRSEPVNDSQFAALALDPLIARAAQAAVSAAGASIDIPAPDRVDLLPLLTYAPPIASADTPSGPVADLLRLNLGVAPTDFAAANRLGLLAGDASGYPNGRRPLDDVTDIVLRVVVGGVLIPEFNVAPNNRLGDGVNINDRPRVTSFPYVAPAQDGRNSRHIDPGEPGCDGGNCPE